MRIIQVVGARPNFMKVAALHRAFSKYPEVKSLIVHTGQHTDPNMSDVFLRQLDLPKPDFFLGVSNNSHVQMMAGIMLEFQKVLEAGNPDLVIVVGDVNSTLACAMTASRMKFPLAHVEAGLRSFDKSMPEENNRIAVDHISDYLFTTEKSANENLRKEMIPDSIVHFTGNCMIDSLVHYLPQIDFFAVKEKIALPDGAFVLMTMHRPSNVDTRDGLVKILELCKVITQKLNMVFPVHPRTRNKMNEFELFTDFNLIPGLILTEPLAYLEFLALMKQSSLVMTDSGGVQEETSFLKMPCLTFRKTTERPVTLEIGSNVLINDFSIAETLQHVDAVLNGTWKQSSIPELWDGRAAERISHILLS